MTPKQMASVLHALSNAVHISVEETRTDRDNAKLIFQEVAKSMRISNANAHLEDNLLEWSSSHQLEQSIQFLRVSEVMLRQLERHWANFGTAEDLEITLNLDIVYERIHKTVNTFRNQITYARNGRTSQKPNQLICVAQFDEAVKIVEQYEKQLSTGT